MSQKDTCWKSYNAKVQVCDVQIYHLLHTFNIEVGRTLLGAERKFYYNIF